MASNLAKVAFCMFLAGCAATPALRRFPLKEPMLADDDQRPWRPECTIDQRDPKKKTCIPAEYISPFVWDGVDAMAFHPITRFLAVDPHGESVNVNALDEVPDSSWFQNRISREPMSPDEVAEGPCKDAKLDPNDAEWVIDQGKANGANPGFRIKTADGRVYLLKVDEKDHPERATAATAIATRLYHAAGYWTGCDQVVYAPRRVLKLTPGLTHEDNTGIKRPFGDKELDEILSGAGKRGDRYRFVASKWLPGKTLGPFTYEGVRKDDPNDVVPHQDRRELRGQRVLAAWLGHFDAREQNSMTTWMTRRESDPASAPGHIRHWIIDLNDCFGSEWKWDAITKRIGFTYYFDGGDVAEDFVTLGIRKRPWDAIQRPGPDGDIFGYFAAEPFDPEEWRAGYQNPAFIRMSELDGAWMARILARLTPEHVQRIVEVGDFTNPKNTDYLVHTLLARQRKIEARFFAVASPLADFEVKNGELCGVDLARKTNTWSDFHYAAEIDGAKAAVEAREGGVVCVPVTTRDYHVVTIANGIAKHPIRVHIASDRVVGLER